MEGRVAKYEGGGREGCSHCSLLRCRGDERLILLSLPSDQWTSLGFLYLATGEHHVRISHSFLVQLVLGPDQHPQTLTASLLWTDSQCTDIALVLETEVFGESSLVVWFEITKIAVMLYLHCTAFALSTYNNQSVEMSVSYKDTWYLHVLTEYVSKDYTDV